MLCFLFARLSRLFGSKTNQRNALISAPSQTATPSRRRRGCRRNRHNSTSASNTVQQSSTETTRNLPRSLSDILDQQSDQSTLYQIRMSRYDALGQPVYELHPSDTVRDDFGRSGDVHNSSSFPVLPISRPATSGSELQRSPDLSNVVSFRATRVLRYKRCPVCLESFGNDNVTMGQCLHAVHSTCLADWLQRDPNKSCPVCRSGYEDIDVDVMIPT